MKKRIPSWIALAGTLFISGAISAQPSRAARLPRSDEALLARVLAMSDARRLDTALVDSALRVGGSYLRASTARAVGQVAGRARVARLRELLSDADTAVAAEAAFALGLLRDSAGTDALAGVLSRPAVGREAAWALGEIGAHGDIERGLRDGTLPVEAHESLLYSASRLRPAPVQSILPYVEHGDPALRRAAAYGIARPGIAAGVRALLPLATSADAETRAFVANAFARRAAGDSLASLVAPALRVMARDADARVRINASRALASHGAVERDAIMALLRDPDPNVRIAAAQSLFSVADSGAAWWSEAWAADTSLTYRRSVLESAARRGIAMTALPEWLSSPDWRRRAAALSAVQALIPAERRPEFVLVSTRDAHAAVRSGALSIILADTLRAGRDSVLAVALADSSVMVRVVGIGALRSGRAPASAAVEALDAYRRASSDRDNDARLLALSVIRGAWRADSGAFSDQLRAQLGRLPRPTDPLERAAAAGVTPLAGWGGIEDAPRAIAWYDSIVRTIVRPALAGRPAMAELQTRHGVLTLELLGADAPLTVANFVRLARSGYYSGTRFHRVVPNFVAQDGDPGGTGSGGPGYAIRDELNRHRYLRGTLGMALSGPDTGGSQYFICHSSQPHLDGHYTIFGQLKSGSAALDRIVQGDAITGVRIR